MMHKTTRVVAAALLALGMAGAQAAEVTLKAVSVFTMDTFFTKRFKQFVDKVNAEGKGLVQINVIGGPEAIPPFEVGNALRSGVIDFANTTAVFHANLVPEALALTLTEKPMSELRQNGGYELMDKIHREKANITWLARTTDGLQYHIYTNKPVTSADLSGFKLRGVPVYLSFFREIGATPLQIPPGEVYTALERGVVDGYGWPSVGVMEMGWHEKTKYRVEPGFYNVEVGFFMNQKSWEKLDEDQKAFMRKQIEWMESQNVTEHQMAIEEKAATEQAGVQALVLEPEAARALRTKAYEAGWAGIDKSSPKYAAQLRELFGGYHP
ncbi:TRAP transporter substrate-binding protein DctP [Alcaligenes faecalis]|uniref:TRAP transporter substrate-binding protein DctP n=1 Tax=Alcaligenes faecalis TaxID=511 RepID=UPI000F0B3BA1|nr:TRAP transporter substrate-binding protein DctP [Alcaligenes faecalis]AYR21101.1 ABC transporter substrate-binding protein [Alcaligenes faecalis]